jgi:hypothetical protein
VLAFSDWSGDESHIDDRDVIALRVSNTGEMLWGNGVTVASGPASQILDSLIPGPDGGVFVGVFSQESEEVGYRMAFHRLAADGSPLWPADGVSIVDPAVNPRTDINWFTFGAFSGTTLRFAWEHHPGSPGDPNNSDIRYGALDLDGNRLAGASGVPLTDGANFNLNAGFAFDPESGAAFTVWQRNVNQEDSDALGAVYVSR